MRARKLTTPEIAAGPQVLDASRFAPARRRTLSGPGLRTFLAIADLWGLSEDERLLVLGLPSRSTYYGWIRAVREHRDITLGLDTLIRISAVLGIHQALGVLYLSEAEGIAWLRRPHHGPLFGDRPPLDLVTSGTQDGLMSVRRFLDAARGGVYMPPNELDQQAQPSTEADIVFS